MYLRRPLLLLAGLAVLAGAEPVPPPSASVKLAPVPLRRPKPVPVRFDAAQPADPAPAAKPAPKKHRPNQAVPKKGHPKKDRPGRAAPKQAAPAERGSLPVAVRLVDGSMLRGTLRAEPLPAKSRALGAVTIDLAKVERLAVGTRHGMLRVHFRNGDRATVRPGVEDFSLDTLLGRVKLPLSKVRSITFNPSTPSTSSTVSTLLYHCTFDSPQSIAHPAAGPAGRFLGGSFVPGKAGRALRVEKDAASFEAAVPKGFLGPEGCVEFWAKIEGDDPRYVDGGDPLFFSLFDERGAVTLLSFAANNGFARGGLAGAIASWPFGTIPHFAWSMDYAKVLGPDWAGWHHYAMSWKAKGFGDGSFVKVFVDGKPQPVLGGVDDDKVPARLADLPNHAFLLGFPWDRSPGDNRRSKKPFLIDEFKIWKTAKTDFAE